MKYLFVSKLLHWNYLQKIVWLNDVQLAAHYQKIFNPNAIFFNFEILKLENDCVDLYTFALQWLLKWGELLLQTLILCTCKCESCIATTSEYPNSPMYMCSGRVLCMYSFGITFSALANLKLKFQIQLIVVTDHFCHFWPQFLSVLMFLPRCSTFGIEP